MNVEPREIAEILGGRRILGRTVTSTRELDEIVREGMPKTALDSVLKKMAGSRHDQHSVAHLRNRIVRRATYDRVDRFNLQVSETTERMARLYAMALAVFNEPKAVTRFMATPHPELGGRTPLETALTEIGGREVEEVIDRGLHGLPA